MDNTFLVAVAFCLRISFNYLTSFSPDKQPSYHTLLLACPSSSALSSAVSSVHVFHQLLCPKSCPASAAQWYKPTQNYFVLFTFVQLTSLCIFITAKNGQINQFSQVLLSHKRNFIYCATSSYSSVLIGDCFYLSAYSCTCFYWFAFAFSSNTTLSGFILQHTHRPSKFCMFILYTIHKHMQMY